MKSNNKHYQDIIIDYNTLNLLPSDGLIFNNLRTYDVDNNMHEEEGGLEDGPVQSNASRPYPNKENAHVTNAYAYVNPLLEIETNNISIRNFLNEVMGTADNPMPFLSQLTRLNNYTYPSIQLLTFPTLFPFGYGDITFHDRNINVSLTESNCYLLRYSIYDSTDNTYVYPFAKYNR